MGISAFLFLLIGLALVSVGLDRAAFLLFGLHMLGALALLMAGYLIGLRRG